LRRVSLGHTLSSYLCHYEFLAYGLVRWKFLHRITIITQGKIVSLFNSVFYEERNVCVCVCVCVCVHALARH